MSVVATIVEKAVEFAYKHFGALQICWLCLLATCGAGWFFASHYATAGEVEKLGADVVEIRAFMLGKNIYDYRVRQCDMTPVQRQEKRWLSEQIRADIEKYERVTGHAFQLPACGDL